MINKGSINTGPINSTSGSLETIRIDTTLDSVEIVFGVYIASVSDQDIFTLSEPGSSKSLQASSNLNTDQEISYESEVNLSSRLLEAASNLGTDSEVLYEGDRGSSSRSLKDSSKYGTEKSIYFKSRANTERKLFVRSPKAGLEIDLFYAGFSTFSSQRDLLYRTNNLMQYSYDITVHGSYESSVDISIHGIQATNIETDISLFSNYETLRNIGYRSRSGIDRSISLWGSLEAVTDVDISAVAAPSEGPTNFSQFIRRKLGYVLYGDTDLEVFIELMAYLQKITYYLINNFTSLRDVDRVSDSFLLYIQKEVSKYLPQNSKIDNREFIKEAKNWYSGKGTLASYKFIGALLDCTIDVWEPSHYIFRPDNPRTLLDGSLYDSNPDGISRLGRLRDGIYWSYYTYVLDIYPNEGKVVDIDTLVNLVNSVHPGGTKYFLDVFLQSIIRDSKNLYWTDIFHIYCYSIFLDTCRLDYELKEDDKCGYDIRKRLATPVIPVISNRLLVPYQSLDIAGSTYGREFSDLTKVKYVFDRNLTWDVKGSYDDTSTIQNLIHIYREHYSVSGLVSSILFNNEVKYCCHTSTAVMYKLDNNMPFDSGTMDINVRLRSYEVLDINSRNWYQYASIVDIGPYNDRTDDIIVDKNQNYVDAHDKIVPLVRYNPLVHSEVNSRSSIRNWLIIIDSNNIGYQKHILDVDLFADDAYYVIGITPVTPINLYLPVVSQIADYSTIYDWKDTTYGITEKARLDDVLLDGRYLIQSLEVELEGAISPIIVGIHSSVYTLFRESDKDLVVDSGEIDSNYSANILYPYSSEYSYILSEGDWTVSDVWTESIVEKIDYRLDFLITDAPIRIRSYIPNVVGDKEAIDTNDPSYTVTHQHSLISIVDLFDYSILSDSEPIEATNIKPVNRLLASTVSEIESAAQLHGYLTIGYNADLYSLNSSAYISYEADDNENISLDGSTYNVYPFIPIDSKYSYVLSENIITGASYVFGIFGKEENITLDSMSTDGRLYIRSYTSDTIDTEHPSYNIVSMYSIVLNGNESDSSSILYSDGNNLIVDPIYSFDSLHITAESSPSAEQYYYATLFESLIGNDQIVMNLADGSPYIISYTSSDLNNEPIYNLILIHNIIYSSDVSDKDILSDYTQIELKSISSES